MKEETPLKHQPFQRGSLALFHQMHLQLHVNLKEHVLLSSPVPMCLSEIKEKILKHDKLTEPVE
jgi:hypothetical protein